MLGGQQKTCVHAPRPDKVFKRPLTHSAVWSGVKQFIIADGSSPAHRPAPRAFGIFQLSVTNRRSSLQAARERGACWRDLSVDQASRRHRAVAQRRAVAPRQPVEPIQRTRRAVVGWSFLPRGSTIRLRRQQVGAGHRRCHCGHQNAQARSRSADRKIRKRAARTRHDKGQHPLGGWPLPTRPS